MTFMQLDKKGAVFVLTLTNGDKDNTFNPDVLAEYHACLDQIEADRSNASLLIVSSIGLRAAARRAQRSRLR